MGTKKILFPLEMQNGVKVHTLEELKEKFDVGRVLEYAGSGQLVKWLRDRRADDIAEKVESFDSTSEEYAREVCEAILEKVNEEVLRQIEEIKEQAERNAEEQEGIDEIMGEEIDLLAEAIKEGRDSGKNYIFDESDPIRSVANKAVNDATFIMNTLAPFIKTKYEDKAKYIIENLYDSNDDLDMKYAEKLVRLAKEAGNSIHESFGCLYSGLKCEDKNYFEGICRKIFAGNVKERDEQVPTLLVNYAGIYVVKGDRVIRCKGEDNFISAILRDFHPDSNGVVQDGKEVYYLKNCSGKALHYEWFIYKINLDTGEEERICETEDVVLCGVRNEKLFYMEKYTEAPYGECYIKIHELALDTLKVMTHKIVVDLSKIDSFRLKDLMKSADSSVKLRRNSYPCIDKSGSHLYCRVTEGFIENRSYVADINLKEDSISAFVLKENHSLWKDNIGDWGIGREDFVVRDSSWNDEKCIYYDMAKNEVRQLPELEKAIVSTDKLYDGMSREITNMCCGEGRIYWLIRVGRDEIDRLILMEYDISVGTYVRRVCVERSDLGCDFGNGVEEIFVSNHYLYINSFDMLTSWRFSLDDWKPEKLVKVDEYGKIQKSMVISGRMQNGLEYKYVAV